MSMYARVKLQRHIHILGGCLNWIYALLIVEAGVRGDA